MLETSTNQSLLFLSARAKTPPGAFCRQATAVLFLWLLSFFTGFNLFAQCITSPPPVSNPNLIRCGTGVGTFIVTGAGLVNGNDVYLLSNTPPTPGVNYAYTFNVPGAPNNNFDINITPVSQYQKDGSVFITNNYNYLGPNLPNVPANGKILLLSNTTSTGQTAFNLGPSSLAGGESLRGYAYANNTVNKMSIFDFNGAPTIAVKFRVSLRNTAPTFAAWQFALGNGGAFSNSALPPAGSPNYFTRINWLLSPNLGAVTSTFTSGAVTNLAPVFEPFTQSSNTLVELYCNNKTTPIIFTRAGVQYVVPAGNMRIWVNNVPVVFPGNTYNMLKNNSFIPNSPINSLMFLTNSANGAEIEVDNIEFQPNIETETILSTDLVLGGTANLTTPVLAPVSVTNYKIAQFSTGAAPFPSCSDATAKTFVSIKVNDVPSPPTNAPATLNVCGAALPAAFTFSLDFGATPGTAFAIYSNPALTAITNDNITYAPGFPGVATTTIATPPPLPKIYRITAVSAPASVGDIVDNAAENALIYPGCRSAAVLMNIQSTTPVVPVIASSAPSVCGTSTTDLINFSTTTAALSYNWNFDLFGNSSVPSGPVSTAGPFNVHWNSTGPKTVQLTITDLNGCFSSATQVVTVHNPAIAPTIQITPSSPPYCTGVPIQITHNAGAGTQSWTFGAFGDATPPSNNNLTNNVNWNYPGGKVITLNYTDPNLCTATVTQSITIEQQPTLTAITPGGLQVCAGAAATMNINGSNILPGATYTWTCDGCNEAPIPPNAAPPINLSWNSALPNPNKTITLQVANPGGCVSSIVTQTVTVVDLPNPTFTLTPSAPPALCTEKNFTLNMVDATGIATYTWNCGGCYQALTNQAPPQTISWPSTVPSPTISVTVTGLAPTNCVATSSQSLALNTITVPTITGPVNSCVGSQATYSVPNIYATYNWVVSGTPGVDYTLTPSTNVNSVNITWLTGGAKAISVTVTDANGCVATANITTNVALRPGIPTFTPAPLYCTGQNYTLSVNAPLLALTYTWNVGGNPSTPASGTGTNFPVTWANAGVAIVTLTATNAAGCTRSSVTNLLINPSPAPPIITAPSVVCGINNAITANAPAGYATYAWTSDANATFTGANTASPTVSWSTLGARNLTLTVGNGLGCFATVTQAVNVNAIPQVATFIGPSTVCIGNNLNITPTYSNLSAPVTYNWGCGSCSPLPPTTSAGPVQISWAAAGTDVVTLSVTNSNGCVSPTASATVTINPFPSSAFSASNSAVCVNATTTVTPADLAAGNTYSWTCTGCAQASTIANTTVGPQTLSWTSALPSVKTVQLIITSGSGCVSTPTTQVITVNPLPVPTITGPVNSCVGSQATYSVPNIYATYNWVVSGTPGVDYTLTPSTNVNSVTITWLTSGAKNVSVTVTDANGCLAASNLHVTSVPAAPSAPSFTPTPPYCVGQNYTLSVVNPITGVTYSWSVAGNASTPPSGTGVNFPVTWSNAGVAVVTLTATDGAGCTSSSVTNLVINPSPVPPTITAPSVVCGINNAITANAPAGYATYTWTSDANATFTGANTASPTVSWSTLGARNLNLTVGNGLGCFATVTQAVNVNAIPQVATFIGPSTVCIGNNLNITPTYSNLSAPVTYNWGCGSCSPLPPTTSAGPVQISWAAAGTDVVTLSVTNSDGCVSPTASATVTINPFPSSAFSASNSAVCVNATTTVTPANLAVGNTYSWTCTGCAQASTIANTTVGPQTLSWTSALPSVKTVQLIITSGSGCVSTPTTQVITVNPLPVPTITGPVNSCVGSTGTYSVPNIYATYNWVIPGTPGTDYTLTPSTNVNSVTITWLTSGAKNVFVTVTDANGCVAASNLHVTNVPAAPSAPSFTPTPPYCVGQNYTLSVVNPITGVTYSWSVTGNASTPPSGTGVNFPVTWSNAGVAVVNLTATDGAGCTSSSVTNLVINPSPVPPTITAPPVVCGTNNAITANAPAGYATYTWTSDANATFTGANTASPTVSWSTLGARNLTLTVGNGLGCFATVTQAVNVNAIPQVATFIGPSTVCIGNNLNITPTYSNLSAPVTYNWGCNSCSSLPPTTSAGPVQISWAAAGTDVVTLSVTNSNGCVSPTASATVTINPFPSSAFSASNSAVCVNATTTVTPANLAAGNTYSWTCTGCAQASTIANTTVGPQTLSWTSALPSVKTVQLIITSGLGCVSAPTTQVITVNPLPTPSITPSGLSVCAGGSLQFTASPTGLPASNYNWSVGAGGSITSGSGAGPITVVWTSTGAKTVQLTVTDANGCTNPTPVSVVITVNNPSATINAPSSVCGVNESVIISASASPGVTYNWNFGAGASSNGNTSASHTVSWSSTGVKFITLTITDANGCSQTQNSAVTVYDKPATPNLTSNSPVCVGQNLALGIANPPSGATYSWSGPGGFTSSLQNPTITSVTTGAAGIYSVTVTAPGCAPVSGSVNVAVNDLPQPVIQASATAICEGGNFSLSVSNPIAGANYVWQGPDGFTSLGLSATVNNATLQKAGVYSVIASLSGCANKVSAVTITVNKPPVAPNPTNNGPLCSGQQLQLNATASPGASYSWAGPGSPSFSGGGAIINPTVANISTSNAGVYSITVSVPGCPSVTGTTTVVVNTPPTAPNLTSNSPACAGQNLALGVTNPASGATYSWSGPNGFTSSLQNPTISNVTTAAAGVYSLTVSVPACSAVTGTITVAVNTPPLTPAVSSNSPVCANAAISLTVSNIVSGASYSWSGPGFSQNAPVAVAQAPSAAGVYTYSATATVAGCAPVVATISITVNAQLSSVAAASAQVLCVGSNLNLTALATPAVSNIGYQWSGPSGYSSTQQNPTFANITTAQAGVYTVTANTPGCSAVSATVNVAVNAAPGAIILTSNSPLCVGQNLQLTATNVSGAQSYEWTDPSGFSYNTATPTLTLNSVSSLNSGAYSVKVTVSGCSATSSATTSVVVQDPGASSIVSNSPVCAGSVLNLQAVGNENIANATYQWVAPNGFTFSGRTVNIPNIAPFFAGTFTLTTTIPNCGNAQKTTNIVVNNAPASPSPSSNSPVCAGSDLILSASGVSGAIYQWSGPGGFAEFTQNVTLSGANVTTANSGEYTVTVTLGGCSRTGTVKVTVGQPLPSDYKISSNSPLCTGETLNLSVPSAPGASFRWSGPGGFSATTQNPSISDVTTAAIGVYSLTVNVPGCPSSFFTHTPVIRITPASPNPQSNAPLCEGSTLRLSATGTPGASYVWTGPNSFTSTLQNPTITNVTSARSGSYNVTVVTEGCAPQSGSVSVTINSIPSVEASSNALRFAKAQRLICLLPPFQKRIISGLGLAA
jgi:cytochrome c2